MGFTNRGKGIQKCTKGREAVLDYFWRREIKIIIYPIAAMVLRRHNGPRESLRAR